MGLFSLCVRSTEYCVYLCKVGIVTMCTSHTENSTSCTAGFGLW